jgi:cytochrome c
MRSLLFTAVAMISIMASSVSNPAAAQDVAAGEKSFRKCLPCHSIGPGAANKVGPEQNGLDGRKAGTVPGFTYSEANKNSGIVWNDATFKEYIADPRAKIPGTKMIFPGIKNPQEATDLWAYIKQFDADGNIKK